ncbi:hypothetical protein PILCRDRAFT_589189 [Piloderma croceum F 1598]|uniref:Uncharacterized protein n=1 Tax=Piloderma croceum (strain F 1598) TaxID=765440 RepID=A0A0C3FEP8_PILCF|nr:hypothetical protein PILCRDRAFT_589189 [Piloderma croceum F 1598]
MHKHKFLRLPYYVRFRFPPFLFRPFNRSTHSFHTLCLIRRVTAAIMTVTGQLHGCACYYSVSHWITIHHSLLSKGNIATWTGVGVLVLFVLTVNGVIIFFTCRDPRNPRHGEQNKTR